MSDLKYTELRLDLPNYKVCRTKSACYPALPCSPPLLWGSEAISFIAKSKCSSEACSGLCWQLPQDPREQRGLIANPHKEHAQAKVLHLPTTKKIKNQGNHPPHPLLPRLIQISTTKMEKALNREIGKSDSLWGKEGLLERESALWQSRFT